MKLKAKPLIKKKAKKPHKGIVKPSKPAPTATAPPKERVSVIAQELRFARALAGHDLRSRARVLKALRKWLQSCFDRDYKFTEEDFIRIWKGLFYAVWMSDKPLAQEELCEDIASLLDLFPPEQFDHAMLMTKAAFRVLATEWYGIDQHRMDKFLMLVRRVLRAALRCVARGAWTDGCCRAFAAALYRDPDCLFASPTPPHARNAASLLTHVCECYFEEIAKVSRGSLSGEALACLAEPLARAARGRGGGAGGGGGAGAAARRALADLPRRTLAGAEYEERRRAWLALRCPAGGPDALEPVSDDDGEDEDEQEDDEDGPLDPRAGRVDAVVPALPPPAGLGRRLRRLAAAARGPARRSLLTHAARFDLLSAGEYPLKEPPPPAAPAAPGSAEGGAQGGAQGGGQGGALPRAAVAARRLQRLEARLKARCGDMPQTGVSRRQRKRLSARSRAGLSVAADLAALATRSGAWRVDDAAAADARPQPQAAAAAPERRKNKKRKLKQTPNGDATAPVPKHTPAPAPARPAKLAKRSKPSAAGAGTPDHVTRPSKPTQLTHTAKVSKTPAPPAPSPAPSLAPSPAAAPAVAAKKPKKAKLATKAAPPPPGPPAPRGPPGPAGSKSYQKSVSSALDASLTPKRVVFALKRNESQRVAEYMQTVRRSPALPYDAARRPPRAALRVRTPGPVNPFYKRRGVK